MYLDYKTKTGQWLTLRPLPLIKREELSRRINVFNKFIPISHQIIDDDSLEYNLRQILNLYELKLEFFDVDEIDCFINNILKINYSVKDLKSQKATEFIEKLKKSTTSSPSSIEDQSQEMLSKLFSSLWGICENAGDALFMLERLPADFLLETVKLRSNDIREMYMTDEEKQKRNQKEMVKKLREKMNGPQREKETTGTNT